MTKILEETLLTNEFTFGFELEAIVHEDNNIVSEDSWVNGNDDTEDDIKDYLDSFLYGSFNNHRTNKNISGESDVHYDGSLQVEEYGDDGFSFEYSSPVLKATPENFARVIHMLKQMKKDGIYTNRTCGFHHHIKFNDMSLKDLIWVYCNLATDADIYETIKFFKNYKFEDSHYASFRELDNLGEALINKDFVRALEYINEEKYRAFRIHPQGTLEWRGPRDFLESQNLEDITDFYKLFNILINRIKRYVDSNTLADTTITKKELFDEFTKAVESGEAVDSLWDDVLNNSKYEPVKSKSVERLLYKMNTNQYFIFEIMKNPKLDSFFKKCMEDYRTRETVFGYIRDDINQRFYKPEQIHKIMSYIKEVLGSMRYKDPFSNFSDLSRSGLARYAYSGKELKELLDNANNTNSYLNSLYDMVMSRLYLPQGKEVYNHLKKILQEVEPELLSGNIVTIISKCSYMEDILFTMITNEDLADVIIFGINRMIDENHIFSVAANTASKNLKSVLLSRKNEWNALMKKGAQKNLIPDGDYLI